MIDFDRHPVLHHVAGDPRVPRLRHLRDASPERRLMSDYDPDAILADPNSHPKHVAYALINIGIRDRGERWAKCANCGDPYQLTDEWFDSTCCSERCMSAFTADLLGSGY